MHAVCHGIDLNFWKLYCAIEFIIIKEITNKTWSDMHSRERNKLYDTMSCIHTYHVRVRLKAPYLGTKSFLAGMYVYTTLCHTTCFFLYYRIHNYCVVKTCRIYMKVNSHTLYTIDNIIIRQEPGNTLTHKTIYWPVSLVH